MQTPFIPETLNRWQHIPNYAGQHWPEYYHFLGRHRDSDALARANFDAGLKAIGGETKTPLVLIVRENHWAVGWVEWIAIHESASEALRIADGIKTALKDYPVVSEDLFSEYEQTEADETWRNCFRPQERIEYIRKHRTQFEFRDFADILGCIRGNYFAGYASELLH